MARYTDAVLEEIRARVDIVDLIGTRVQLKRAGATYKGCCPFHKEDTPSFIWSDKPDGLYYHCFGQCNRKYDILDHFVFFYHLTYINAVKKLFELTGIEYTFGEQGVKTKTDREYHYPYPDCQYYLKKFMTLTDIKTKDTKFSTRYG